MAVDLRASEGLDSYLKFIEARGVSRRSFLKYCGATAGMLGLSASQGDMIATALAEEHDKTVAKRPSVVWLNFASDSGCTESLLKSSYPSAAELILDTISMDYNETIMAPSGEAAEKSRKDAMEAGGYLLVVEGGVPTKNGYGMIAGMNMTEILDEMVPNAAAIIAVGSCATFGGVPAMDPNPSEIKGIQEYLGEDYSVINLDMCPVNPRNLAATIVSVIVLETVPELDEHGRPLMFHSQTIHDNCDRRAHFDAGNFVEILGDEGEGKGYCLYKVGCKGPMTHSNCPDVKWNDRTSWCVGAGGPCIGCAEHGWPDEFAGFYERLAGVKVPGIGGVEAGADKLGAGLAVATVGGIAVHAIASGVSKRGKEPSASDGEQDSTGGAG